MKPRLFVDVDTQYDFCDPNGALFVSKAPAILDNVRRLIRASTTKNELLVGSVDSHNYTAWEFAANGGPFPPHCVKGTPGWLKMPGTLPERAVFVPDLLRSKHDDVVPTDASAVYFEKEVYSMFANPEAEPLIDHLLARRSLDRGSVSAIVFGVATDYCVKAAAEGLHDRGFEVSVVVDAVAAVDDRAGADTLDALATKGVRWVKTEDVL
ncbi:MAG: isochorismatase family cysteine hydrolase [Myxococcota bacterium]